ncbi:shikimate kinase [Flavobacterium wongokense]|uniref:shikimate kinase n=1 Tax=Flavobacterium wongokense TaxID=2910674 RepID=UPI001F36AB44|nr:shikimate kinase [Flavobacterium sp. WG47]MCF6132729.1 AAA family ATPase [Flavobacterium sp. WG47]
MQKIILVGYMAVGKTTIADLLSDKINFKAIDLDKLIENKAGLSINEIFKQKGEIYFRRIEHELFTETLKNTENLIISTGGGTPCYANNHLLLNGENVTSIYLKASLDIILERLKSAKSERPLVAGKSDEELKEFVAKHLFERSYFYNQAGFTILIDGKTPEAITEEIIRLLH